MCEAIATDPADGMHACLATMLDQLVNKGIIPRTKDFKKLHRQLFASAGYADDTDDRYSADTAELLTHLGQKIPLLGNLFQIQQTPLPAPESQHQYTFSPFGHDFHIRVKAPQSHKEIANLADLIAAVSVTPIETTCPIQDCNGRNVSMFYVDPWPQFLAVHIDRQYHDAAKQRQKTSRAAVTVPDTLTMNVSPDYPDRRFIFEVHALACHNGVSGPGGHWTAIVKGRHDPTTLWKCNDKDISRVRFGQAGVVQFPFTSKEVVTVLYEQVRVEGEPTHCRRNVTT